MPKQKTFYKGFASIDKLIKATAKEHNLETAFYRHKALKHWHEVAGSFVEEAKEQSQAIDLKKGVLTIACLSRETASKLKLLAQRIINALNAFLGETVIYGLFVQT